MRANLALKKLSKRREEKSYDNKKNNNPFASGFPTGGGFGGGSGIPSPFAGGFNSPYPDLFGGNLETKNDFDKVVDSLLDIK